MPAAPAARPNLLLITSDQQHWTAMGVRNPKIRTPNLDRLAAMGTDFTRAYCPNPTCTPTRATLLTGQYPSTHGAYTLGTKLPDDAPTLGGYLSEAGYQNTLIGKAHFQPLASTDGCPGVECYPTLRDLDFWAAFNDTHTPWYGFDRVELARNHVDEGHVGQHYALWMEEKGLKNWRDYFQPRNDGVTDTPTDAALAPPVADGPGYGWRGDMAWKLPQEFHYTAWTGERTLAAIDEAHAAGKPFFVWSSYHDPHPPYAVPEPWAGMYDPADMEVGSRVEGEMDDMPPPHRATTGDGADGDVFGPLNVDGKGNHGYHPHVGVTVRELQEAQAIYYGMVSFMDHWIGQTLDRLETLGILDHTLVVFTSDHGHFLGQHGLLAKGPFHYEDVIRVPLTAAWPGHLPAGKSSDAIQSLVDIAPTFAAAAGLGVPRTMQGLDQTAAWSGLADPPRDHAIVENHHQDSDAVHLRTLVTGRYKITVYRGRDWGELFDLQDDPGELKNRYDDPDYAGVRSELMQHLVQADLAREPAVQRRVAGA